MIKETYLSNLKNIPRDAITVKVSRPSILAPSKELLNDWKAGRISWDRYRQRYINQIENNHDALQMLEHIRWQARTKDVYIYCYERFPEHCHRSILLEMLKE